MGIDPGRIPEIPSLETEPDEPRTETRWPWKKKDILERGTGQVKVVCTLVRFSDGRRCVFSSYILQGNEHRRDGSPWKFCQQIALFI